MKRKKKKKDVSGGEVKTLRERGNLQTHTTQEHERHIGHGAVNRNDKREPTICAAAGPQNTSQTSREEALHDWFTHIHEI